MPVTVDHRARSRGFTLVEALVALLVLSIGLLGVAGLQLVALQNNSSASIRSQATFLAYDMADRMRANRDQAIDLNVYQVAYGDTPDGSSRAAEDVAAWKAMLAATLPGGDGAIGAIDPVNRIVTITIRWVDSKDPSGVDDDSLIEFVTETRI